MGKHASAGRHESRSVAPHRLIGGNVFGVHALRFRDEHLFDLRYRTRPQPLKFLLHAPNRPEKIHRGWTSLADNVANLVKFRFQFADGADVRVLHAQRNAHRRGHANGRRAAYHHGANHLRDFFMGRAIDVGFFRRQLRLINKAHSGFGPFKSLDHKTVVGRWPLALSR